MAAISKTLCRQGREIEGSGSEPKCVENSGYFPGTGPLRRQLKYPPLTTFLFVYRISFAVDEKGLPVANFSVRPTVLNPPKQTSNTSKKLSRKGGGPNRNNHVLMEFYLNKVFILILSLDFYIP